MDGVIAIVYNEMGENYYLVLKGSSGWSFPKTFLKDREDITSAALRAVFQATGLKGEYKGSIGENFSVEKDGQMLNLSVVFIETNMNIPVKLDSSFETYLWAKKDRILEKLSLDLEKEILDRAEKSLK